MAVTPRVPIWLSDYKPYASFIFKGITVTVIFWGVHKGIVSIKGNKRKLNPIQCT